MEDREETTNASGVYTVIQRNCIESTGKQISYIIAFPLWVTLCSLFKKDITWVSNSLFIHFNKNKKVLYLTPISNGSSTLYLGVGRLYGHVKTCMSVVLIP